MLPSVHCSDGCEQTDQCVVYRVHVSCHDDQNVKRYANALGKIALSSADRFEEWLLVASGTASSTDNCLLVELAVATSTRCCLLVAFGTAATNSSEAAVSTPCLVWSCMTSQT